MLEIRKLEKKDYKLVRAFAAKGMRFDRFFDHPRLMNLYTLYFFNDALMSSKWQLALYDGDRLLSVLFASTKDENQSKHAGWRKVYVSLFNFVQKHFFKDAASPYEIAN